MKLNIIMSSSCSCKVLWQDTENEDLSVLRVVSAVASAVVALAFGVALAVLVGEN